MIKNPKLGLVFFFSDLHTLPYTGKITDDTLYFLLFHELDSCKVETVEIRDLTFNETILSLTYDEFCRLVLVFNGLL